MVLISCPERILLRVFHMPEPFRENKVLHSLTSLVATNDTKVLSVLLVAYIEDEVVDAPSVLTSFTDKVLCFVLE